MEVTNWLLSEISGFFLSLFKTLFFTGFLCGVLGFILGVVIILIGRRKKLFNRPNRIWTIVAKSNYLYLPFLLSTIFWLFGSIMNMQGTINGWIQDSADAIQLYTEDYVPSIEKIGQQLITSAEQSEDALYAAIIEGTGLEKSRFKREFYYKFNRTIIQFVLVQLGYSNDVMGLAEVVQKGELKRLNKNIFQGLSGHLQKYFVGSYFNYVYGFLIMLFLPFILGPIIEYAIYFASQRIPKLSLPKSSTNYSQEDDIFEGIKE